MARVTAVFANHAQADAAIAELRQRGVSDSHLSIVAKRVDDVEVEAGPDEERGATLRRAAGRSRGLQRSHGGGAHGDAAPPP